MEDFPILHGFFNLIYLQSFICKKPIPWCTFFLRKVWMISLAIVIIGFLWGYLLGGSGCKIIPCWTPISPMITFYRYRQQWLQCYVAEQEGQGGSHWHNYSMSWSFFHFSLRKQCGTKTYSNVMQYYYASCCKRLAVDGDTKSIMLQHT